MHFQAKHRCLFICLAQFDSAYSSLVKSSKPSFKLDVSVDPDPRQVNLFHLFIIKKLGKESGESWSHAAVQAHSLSLSVTGLALIHHVSLSLSEPLPTGAGIANWVEGSSIFGSLSIMITSNKQK